MTDPHDPPPTGAPEVLIVEGILDGRVLNEDTLRQAVLDLSNCGAGSFRLEITGGRFNVVPSETQVPPGRFDIAAQANFLDRLQTVANAAQPESVETNLRCKLIYEHEVTETLFVLKGHQIEPVTRRRLKSEQDRKPLALAQSNTVLGIRRREILWLVPLLLIAGALAAWQSGWIDRILAARAETIQTKTGPFQDTLDINIRKSWGSYYVTLRRGPRYPTTPQELAARSDNSDSLTEHAVYQALGSGALFVQLEQAEGQLLAESRVDLRPLLTDEHKKIEVKLPGHMSAQQITLSVSSRKPPK